MPDYMYQIESRLSAEQHAALVRIQELAMTYESNLYLAGGAVRDMISGMPIRDLDFTVEGNPSRIVRELVKGGAQVTLENESTQSTELLLAGEVDVSISAARDDVYARPGAKPDIRFSTIMDDLKRRDFSINAIAISLSANSRGLLLDPTNGLADLERREIRALSIHSFTNQPVRMLRALRYGARMGFRMDSRTAEWFQLAKERKLQDTIPEDDAGGELWQLAREEKPVAILKSWEAEGLLEALHPQLAKRHPDYDALNRITRVRDDLMAAGFRPRLFAPVTAAIMGRLKDREHSAVLSRMALRAKELHAVQDLETESLKVVKQLAGPKTASVRDAYTFLEKTPLDYLGYILAESSNGKAVGKIRNYLNKWRPLRQALPGVAVELENLGLERGPKFDKVLEEVFQAQLTGRGRNPEDRVKILRKLSGIKEPPKKVEEKKKPEKAKRKGDLAAAPASHSAGEAVRSKGAAPAPRAVAGKQSTHKSSAAHAQAKGFPKGNAKKKATGKK